MINMIMRKIYKLQSVQVYFEEMTEKRQKGIQHVFDFFNERNIKYNLEFIKGNPKASYLN